MTNLFFDLIRVAIGSQLSLSRLPSADEWDELFELAKKQSLVGVTFIGLQKLGADADEGYTRIGMSEDLYFTWIGVAAKINVQNEFVNKQCAKVQEELDKAGFEACILKGQGVGSLYRLHDNDNNLDLAPYRQSGDIDVWVNAPKEKVVAWAKSLGVAGEESYLHIGLHAFEDTEVELHYKPSYMRSIRHNKRLQRWLRAESLGMREWDSSLGFRVPTYGFNVVYLLTHMYRHLFGMGIGLRQLMDYYFVLKTLSNSPLKGEKLTHTLKRLGLLDFAGAVMYVMREVFHLEEDYMICGVDERRGRHLLEMAMQTGNFGNMDVRQKVARSTRMGSLRYKCSQWWQLLWLYPEETLSAPLWSLTRTLDKN